jgi:molybdopterin-guanine dinucleotide biosynthesis protein A
LTDDLIISCNRNQQRYAELADQLVCDREQDFPGPLAGIRAAVEVARHPWLLVLPCDAPRIDRPLLEALHRIATAHPERPAMVCRGSQWEPLFCMIPTCLAPDLERAWQAGERSVRRILLEFEPRALQIGEGDPRMANLNSPDLLAEPPPPAGT